MGNYARSIQAFICNLLMPFSFENAVLIPVIASRITGPFSFEDADLYASNIPELM